MSSMQWNHHQICAHFLAEKGSANFYKTCTFWDVFHWAALEVSMSTRPSFPDWFLLAFHIDFPITTLVRKDFSTLMGTQLSFQITNPSCTRGKILDEFKAKTPPRCHPQQIMPYKGEFLKENKPGTMMSYLLLGVALEGLPLDPPSHLAHFLVRYFEHLPEDDALLPGGMGHSDILGKGVFVEGGCLGFLWIMVNYQGKKSLSFSSDVPGCFFVQLHLVQVSLMFLETCFTIMAIPTKVTSPLIFHWTGKVQKICLVW